LVIVGRTREEAREKKALLDSLVHPDSGVPNLSMRLGVDASGFALDEPLPDIPQSNASHSSRDGLVALARRENLTVRQLAQTAGSYGGFQIVGTPADIADTMQEWLETEASDGFNVMFHTVPSGLNEFVDLVVPELQRRGLFRREYEGTTLREHLGLPRPDNQFFPVGQPSKAS
jgi:alkanesulfonate monooxygenase SsuD/methylene tetrahydromethanopterin reductase-like flavin-dependent oxidoreductase (luciferase family)